MARLARLALPGLAHYLWQRGHNGSAIVHDDEDRAALLQVMREAARGSGVQLHAYSIGPDGWRALATPETDGAISRMVQALGRRYVARFNRRHARTGALWDGRFRCAPVEPGLARLQAMCDIDGRGLAPDLHAGATGIIGSGAHRTGGARDAALVDPPEYWALGNTPFERESRYRQQLDDGLPADAADRLDRAVRGAWAFGSPAFLADLAERARRPVQPRPRGRPPNDPTGPAIRD